MIRLLVSVRDVAEAGAAAAAGADFIDLKEPGAGALGGLAPERIEAIVQHLRAAHPGLPVSATIGDWPCDRRAEILERVARVAACGVDYVKVGIALPPGAAAAAPPAAGAARGARTAVSPTHEAAHCLVHDLARCRAAVVPVLIADGGVDAGLVAAALQEDAFPAVMLDTADKRGGSLLQRVPLRVLAGFVRAVQDAGRLAGVAGALRAADVPALRALAPDFAGFRSAVCDGDRAGALDPGRVAGLRARLAASAHALATGP